MPTYADAILDRLVHNAHRIELSGESLRKTRKREPQRRIDRNQKQASTLFVSKAPKVGGISRNGRRIKSKSWAR